MEQKVKKINLGIIGMSEGNGHPYSWSAIFNGFDPQYMKDCPFASIPEYLGRQTFPEDAIQEAIVSHIWTQDRKLSEHIAKASHIPLVAAELNDMIGQVDGILLARDDAEHHYEMAKPFLEAGMPVFIDKPLAYTTAEANEILSLQRYEGQLFTCSSLRYAKEFILSEKDKSEIGTVKLVDATVPKSWKKYAIHIIEPVLHIIGEQGKMISITNTGTAETDVVTVIWESGLATVFYVTGESKCPFAGIRLFGSNGFKELRFSDTFYAFKASLQEFINSIIHKSLPIDRKQTMQVISIIEKGAKKNG